MGCCRHRVRWACPIEFDVYWYFFWKAEALLALRGDLLLFGVYSLGNAPRLRCQTLTQLSVVVTYGGVRQRGQDTHVRRTSRRIYPFFLADEGHQAARHLRAGTAYLDRMSQR